MIAILVARGLTNRQISVELILVVPIGAEDLIPELGKHPIADGAQDASMNHVRHLYG